MTAMAPPTKPPVPGSYSLNWIYLVPPNSSVGHCVTPVTGEEREGSGWPRCPLICESWDCTSAYRGHHLALRSLPFSVMLTGAALYSGLSRGPQWAQTHVDVFLQLQPLPQAGSILPRCSRKDFPSWGLRHRLSAGQPCSHWPCLQTWLSPLGRGYRPLVGGGQRCC